jgi:hypothetical protein
MTRKAVMIITAKSNLIKTIVIGWKVWFAILNHINEKDQKIIDNTTAPYVLILVFNIGISRNYTFFDAANLYLKLIEDEINLIFFDPRK